MSPPSVGLPEALERAASALPGDAESIRPANGDPVQLGHSLEASAATRVLAWLLEHEPDAGADLASAWAEDPETGSAAVLSVDGTSLPKAGRKALRRVVHHLRSRGVAIPEPVREPVVRALPPVEEVLDEAMITPVDPSGARVACLAMDHPAGGVRLFEIVIHDDLGVMDFEVFNAGRGKVRKFLRDFGRRDRFAAVPAPPSAVRAAVARALGAQSAARPAPRALSEWRSRVAVVPEGTLTPGEIALAELGDEGDVDAAVERLVTLVRGGSLGPWPPPMDTLNGIAEKISEAAKGVIIVSGMRRREQVDAALADALGEIYVEPFLTRTIGRLEETAFALWKSDAEADARACLVAARAFRERAPAENPLARAMLEHLLAPVLENLDDEAGGEEVPPLLVEP